MAEKKDIHIVPREDGWAVRREGASRDSSHHNTKADATDAGRTTARREELNWLPTARMVAFRIATATAEIRTRPRTGNTKIRGYLLTGDLIVRGRQPQLALTPLHGLLDQTSVRPLSAKH